MSETARTPWMTQDQRHKLLTKLKEMKTFSENIRDNNFTQKTTGKNYPINVGYATAVRRPFRDLLRWMKDVEEILETIIKEEATTV